jgi:sRNA-binding regulator protein Hfq
MKPFTNDQVKIYFKNGFQVEGRVYSWGKNIILTSEDKNSFMVISKPKEIVMYKVVKSNAVYSEPLPTSTKEEPLEENDVEIDTQSDPSLSLELRGKNLAELHKLKIEEEKKAIAQKLKEHHISEVKKANYELPGFFQKQSTK